MPKILAFLFLLTSCLTFAQKLTPAEKREYKTALKQMEASDQFLRQEMVKHPELNRDSLWKIQSQIDSLNFLRFSELVSKYGYPDKKRIGDAPPIGLLLHFTEKKHFDLLLPIFDRELKNGNMPAFEYAVWHDRSQSNMGKPRLYHEYGKSQEIVCPPLLEEVNKNRKEIGLEPLAGNPKCK